MRNERAKSAWANLLGVKHRGGSSASLKTRARAELLEWWGQDVWNWLTGIDTTTHRADFLPDREFPQGIPVIWTTDERDNEVPVKPFPGHLDYLKHYTHAAVSTAEEDKLILVEKCRQMLATTAVLLAWDWRCRHEPARRFLWSKVNQEDAADQLNEKVRAMDLRLPRWVREAHNMTHKPYHRIFYKNTRSKFLAVNEVAAFGAARGGTATAIGVDEAAFINFLKKIWVASMPMAAKVFVLSTANFGPPDSSAAFMFEQIKPGRIYRPARPSRVA